MPLNKGKAWEAIFKSGWFKSFPNGTIDRLQFKNMCAKLYVIKSGDYIYGFKTIIDSKRFSY